MLSSMAVYINSYLCDRLFISEIDLDWLRYFIMKKAVETKEIVYGPVSGKTQYHEWCLLFLAKNISNM